MGNAIPANCEVWYKLRTEPMSGIKLGVVLNDPTTDSDPTGLAGIQNEGKIQVPFNAELDKYDLFYRSVSPDGKKRVIKIIDTDITFNLLSGIDADDTEIIISEPAYTELLTTGSLLKLDSEYVHLASVTDNGDGTYTLVAEERGAHGTTAATHTAASTIVYAKFSIPHNAITLSEYSTNPPDPSNLAVEEQLNEMVVTWDWYDTATDDQESVFSHFEVYYDTDSNFGTTKIHRLTEEYWKFTPWITVSGNRHIDSSEYYFKVRAVDKIGNTSSFTSPVSGSIAGNTITGPPVPDTTLTANGQYRLIAKARKPTDTTGYNFYANVKEADIEIYYGSSGDPNTDTLLNGVTTTDSKFPYEYETGVTSTGYYWARSLYRDQWDIESEWNSTTPTEFTEADFTPDTDNVDTSEVGYDVDIWRAWTELHDLMTVASINDVLISIYANAQNNSAKTVDLMVRRYESGNFDTTNGFTSGEDLSTYQSSYPGMFLVTRLYHQYKWEFTARVNNAYGNGEYMSPVTITTVDGKTRLESDADVPYLTKFDVYTSVDQATPSDPIIGSGSYAFDLVFGDNNQTTFAIDIEAVEGTSSFPSETKYWDQSDGTLVANKGTHTYTVTLAASGLTADELKGRWIRVGKRYGKNNENVALEELLISSNTAATAGNPSTITLRGKYVVQNTGTQTDWEIINSPIRLLVDYHKTIFLDLSGNPWSLTGTVMPRQYVQMMAVDGFDPKTYKFRARAHNIWGRGAQGSSSEYIYGQSAYLESGVTAVTIGYVTSTEQAPGSTNWSTDVEFDTSSGLLKWTAGSLVFSGGTLFSINAETTGKTITGPTWVYFSSAASNIFQVTTDLASTLSDTKAIIGYANQGEPNPMFFPFIAGKLTVSRENLQANLISANEIVANTITSSQITTEALTGLLIQGSTIRTGESYPRVEMTSDAFTTYDGGGNILVTMSTNGADPNIALTPSDTIPGKITFGTDHEIFAYNNDNQLYLIPQADEDGGLFLGAKRLLRRYNYVHIDTGDAYAGSAAEGFSGILLRASDTDNPDNVFSYLQVSQYDGFVRQRVFTTSAYTSIDLMDGQVSFYTSGVSPIVLTSQYTWPASQYKLFSFEGPNLGSSKNMFLGEFASAGLFFGTDADDAILGMVGGSIPDDGTWHPKGAGFSVGGEDRQEASGGGEFHLIFGGRGTSNEFRSGGTLDGERTGKLTFTKVTSGTNLYQQILWMEGDAAGGTDAYIFPYQLQDAGGGNQGTMDVRLGTDTWPFYESNVKTERIHTALQTAGSVGGAWTADNSIKIEDSAGNRMGTLGQATNLYGLELGSAATMNGGFWANAKTSGGNEPGVFIAQGFNAAGTSTSYYWFQHKDSIRYAGENTAPGTSYASIGFEPILSPDFTLCWGPYNGSSYGTRTAGTGGGTGDFAGGGRTLTTGANSGDTIALWERMAYATCNTTYTGLWESGVGFNSSTSVYAYIGLGDSTGRLSASTDWIGFQRTTGNWFTIAEKGGVQRSTDSSVAFATGFKRFKMLFNNSSIKYYIDDTLVYTESSSTYIPLSTYLYSQHEITTQTTAARIMYVNYLKITQHRAGVFGY